MGDLWVIFALGSAVSSSVLSLWVWRRAERGFASAASTKSATLIRELQTELVEVQDQIEQMQKILRKRSARSANAARWESGGEPDPAVDPQAWKDWINNRGGLRRYTGG